jgi:hypothetical protein
MGLTAGTTIRKLVPEDPAQVFADRLVEIAQSKGDSEKL